MSIFNINFPNDGVYFDKYQDIGLWYSNLRTHFRIPRIWIFDRNEIAYLSYITETEYNLIVAEFSSYPNYELRQGPDYIEMFGPPIRINSSVPKGDAYRAPVYFKTNALDLHKLVYLTPDQITFLKAQNVELANSNFTGPMRIPMFQDFGPGDTPTTSGPLSGASFNNMSVVTDGSGNMVTDGSGNPVYSGGGSGGS